jgi:thiamine biosynthesis lipoprotein
MKGHAMVVTGRRLAMFLIVLASQGCGFLARQPEQGWYSETRDLYYGLPVQVTFSPANEQLSRQVWSYLESIDDVFNDYKAGSEISALNRRNAAGEVTLSPMLAEAFEKARLSWQISEEVFDVTCAPMRNLWRQAEKRGVLPSDAEISVVREQCGLRLVKQDANRLTLSRSGLQFDFGGMVKGLIADRVVEMLKAGHVRSALVQIGRETAVFGPSSKGRPFRIAVQHPMVRDGTWCVIRDPGTGLSASSSGNYENPVVVNGVKFYHIFDPRTGHPAPTDILSVNIVFPETGKNWLADTLSTTGVILGPAKTFEIVRKYGGEAMFLVWKDGKIEVITSSGWESFQ